LAHTLSWQELAVVMGTFLIRSTTAAPSHPHDRREQAEELFRRSECIVWRGAAGAWPCRAWDAAWLDRHLGECSVKVSYKDSCGDVVRRGTVAIRQLLNEARDEQAGLKPASADGLVAYADNFDIAALIPEQLRTGVPSASLFGANRDLVIYSGFLGLARSVTRIHVDSEDNLITTIFGRKLFVLLPPSAQSHLDFEARDVPLDQTVLRAVTEADLSAPELIEEAEAEATALARRHPMFRQCPEAVRVVVLQGGDILVQPQGWSHWVHNLDLAFSVPCWAKALPPPGN